MPSKSSRKKRIIHFSIFTLLFLVCMPVIILYSLGYALDENTFDLSSRGGIYVLATEPGVTVYVGDNIKETTGIFNKEVLVKDLKPKDYLVLAGAEEFWPWAKIVTVTEGEVSALYPLLIPKSFSFKEILKTDDLYKDAANLFLADTKKAASAVSTVATSTIKTVKETATSSIASSTAIAKAQGITKGKMRVWKENNSIFASWSGSADRIPSYFCGTDNICVDTITVFQSATPVGRIDFYPGREDAIMLTLDRGIYAMEIDIRNYHNFYPIYKGNDPDFRIDGTDVYIKDGDNLSVIEL